MIKTSSPLSPLGFLAGLGLATCGLIITSDHAIAREVRKDELKPFASRFSCSDPFLQRMFDRLITLRDENGKALRKSHPDERLPLIIGADDRTGKGGWLYRGVTNTQFSENQVLKLIFNDRASTSESRWLTDKMFKTKVEGLNSKSEDQRTKTAKSLVRKRADFQSLPIEEQCQILEASTGQVRKSIESLLSTVNDQTELNAFEEHVNQANEYNSTPVAIQFLTPHKEFAEKYGEFVLHIRETVPRGIDVQRYNWHLYGRPLKDIYKYDVDEYMVPSHIPPWDVQIVKVRPGTGWLKEDYGPPIYYFSKITEELNPCNVEAIRVDKPDPSGIDSRRSPVGLILQCTQDPCESHWDHQLSQAAKARLKKVIETTTVNGNKLRYVPYAEYRKDHPEIIRNESLTSIEKFFKDGVSDKIKSDSAFWREVLLAQYPDHFSASVRLAHLTQLSTDPKFVEEWKQNFIQFIHSKDFALDKNNAAGLLELCTLLDMGGSSEILSLLIKSLESPSHRPAIVSAVELASKKDPKLATLFKEIKSKFLSYKQITPLKEIEILQSETFESASVNLPEVVARGLSREPTQRLWKVLKGNESNKRESIESALLYISRHPGQFPDLNSFDLWRRLAPLLENSPGRENILGLCISIAGLQGKLSGLQIMEEVSKLELPKEREVDTIRSIWGRIKSTPSVNAYEVYSNALVERFYDKLANARETQKELKKSFIQFFGESINPPQQIIGFAALNNIRKITKDDRILLLPEGDSISIDIDGKPIQIDGDSVKSILEGSISTYYLNWLKDKLKQEKDPSRQEAVKKTLKGVLDAYEDYALGSLVEDMKDPQRSNLIRQRFKWNRNEDVAGLVLMLAEIADDDKKKRALRKVSEEIRVIFPEMRAKLPAVFSEKKNPAQVAAFWQQSKVHGEVLSLTKNLPPITPILDGLQSLPDELQSLPNDPQSIPDSADSDSATCNILCSPECSWECSDRCPLECSGVFPPITGGPTSRKGRIRIISAVRNLPFKITVGNVTRAAAAFCDGQNKRRYKVSNEHLGGDPAPGWKKSFDIKWSCSNLRGQVKSVSRSADQADGAVFDIECPDSGEIKILEATYGKNLMQLTELGGKENYTQKVQDLCGEHEICAIPAGVSANRIKVSFSCEDSGSGEKTVVIPSSGGEIRCQP